MNDLHLTIDLHCHSVASGHAFNTVDELASEAALRGIELLGVSDHGPSMEGTSEEGYFEMAQRFPKRLGGIRVWFGCEANITDLKGTLDLSANVIDGLDYLLAGLHARTPYPLGESSKANTMAIVACMKACRPLAITHPYTIAFPTIVDDVALAAADHGVALEVNLSRVRASIAKLGEACEELHYTAKMLSAAEKCGAAVIIGSDAHHRIELGATSLELGRFSDILGFDLRRAINFLPERWGPIEGEIRA